MKTKLLALLLLPALMAGCGWFWNQKPACPDGWDETVQGCKGMPPFVPMARPDGGSDALDGG